MLRVATRKRGQEQWCEEAEEWRNCFSEDRKDFELTQPLSATLIFGGGGGEHLFCLCFGNLSALPGREERGWISAMRNPLSVSPGGEARFLLQRLNVEGGTEEWEWRREHTCLPRIKAHNTQMSRWKVKTLNETLQRKNRTYVELKWIVPNLGQALGFLLAVQGINKETFPDCVSLFTFFALS